MTTSNTSMLVTLLPLIILGVIGLILIVIGLRRWRLGDEPRCRSCLYNLTGLTSGRCPECGHSIVGPYSIVIGLRKRKPKIACAGFAMIVPLLTIPLNIGYSTLKTSGLFPCLPFSWVLNSAKSDSKQALNEIDRRLSKGYLSQNQLAELAEVALTEQPRSICQQWTDWLEYLNNTQILSPEQADLFLDQMLWCSLTLRSPIRSKDPIVSKILCGGTLPLNSTYVISEHGYSITIAGQCCHSSDGEFKFADSNSWGLPWGLQADEISRRITSKEVQSLPAGKHEAILSCNMHLHRNENDRDSGKAPLRAVTTQYKTEIEILPPNVTDPVRYVEDPSQTAVLRKAIRILPIRTTPSPRVGYVHCECVLLPTTKKEHQILPVDIAFDMIAKTSIGEIQVGSFACKAKVNAYAYATWETQEFSDESMTVILRPSLEAARNSMNIFSVWNGELVFNQVPIDRPRPRYRHDPLLDSWQ